MNKLIEELNLKLVWELDDVFAFKNEHLYVQFINPHEGTDFKYMIRADFKENFAKWGNCFYEEEFDDLERDLPLIIKDLKKMVIEKDKMLVKIVEGDQVYYEASEYADGDWQFYKIDNSKKERQIRVSLTPHEWDNKDEPYYWTIVELTKDSWVNSGLCGWSKTPQEAWLEASKHI